MKRHYETKDMKPEQANSKSGSTPRPASKQVKRWFFPAHQISIVAETLEEAEKKLPQALKEREANQ